MTPYEKYSELEHLIPIQPDVTGNYWEKEVEIVPNFVSHALKYPHLNFWVHLTYHQLPKILLDCRIKLELLPRK